MNIYIYIYIYCFDKARQNISLHIGVRNSRTEFREESSKSVDRSIRLEGTRGVQLHTPPDLSFREMTDLQPRNVEPPPVWFGQATSPYKLNSLFSGQNGPPPNWAYGEMLAATSNCSAH